MAVTVFERMFSPVSGCIYRETPVSTARAAWRYVQRARRVMAQAQVGQHEVWAFVPTVRGAETTITTWPVGA